MVLVPAPGKVVLGEDRERSEVEIRHDFALAAREVTVAEFRRCPHFKDHEYFKQYAPTSDCPVNNVSWYMAAEYCNWLSEQEGLQRCYVPNEKGKYAEGMKVAADFLKRSGYRLPMEAEWECACRGGSDTTWSMGEAEDLLGRYAWIFANAAGKSHPVGALRPNDWGLFDMHGNAWEWCQDRESPQVTIAIDDKEDIKYIKDHDNRVLRGGSFYAPESLVRCANRQGVVPLRHVWDVGFRPARTYR
jgi:formylglycine-generating enzyme required for sulfatase activity